MPPADDQGAGTLHADDPGGRPLYGDPGRADPGETRAPARWRRIRKLILIAAAMVVVIVLVAASGVYLVTDHYLSSMKRIHNPFTSIPAAERPPKPAGAPGNDVTFLVGGLDTRSAVPTTGKQAASDARGRTDTLMLVHFIAGGHGAYVVSIPRDSWVPIPGYGDGKVNWAYYFGGPTLAVRTVEKLTDVRIDHVVTIDWDGFRAVTNALGGVTVDVPVTSYDPSNRITWTAGIHHLDGAQALLYVRDRYGLASGDFDRERRQQYFLRTVFKQLRDQGRLTNPLQASSLLRALTGAVSVDNTLSNGQITSLALSLRKLSLSSVVFATVPNVGTGTVGSQSVVQLNRSLDPGFWHAFEYDTLPAYMKSHGMKRLGSTTQ